MASGVLRRSALWCHHMDGVFDSGWRQVVTGIGNMIEPSPISLCPMAGSDVYDLDPNDQIGHVDDVQWTKYDDWNLLSGTKSDIQGSANGWVHGGVSLSIKT